MVQAEGLEEVFEYPGAVSHDHTWGLNGEFLAESRFLPNVIHTPASGDSPARLIIPVIAQYNNTVVQCRANVEEGGSSFRSVLSFINNATLRVQGGKLDALVCGKV